MSFYKGIHANLYDLFYDQKDYKKEAEFIHKCITDHGSEEPVNFLELACGTGSHVSFLANHFPNGKFLCTDLSESMISVAKQKNQLQNVQFQEMNMLDFQGVDNQSIDCVTCLFDSLGYVKTNDNIIKVLGNVKQSLKPGGLFIFEFWNAGAMLKSYDQARVKRFTLNDYDIVRISETKLDYFNQTAEVNYTIQRFLNGVFSDQMKEKHTNRYFLIQEMMLLIEQGGLELVEIYSGFTKDREITIDDWHSVVVCRA